MDTKTKADLMKKFMKNISGSKQKNRETKEIALNNIDAETDLILDQL